MSNIITGEVNTFIKQSFFTSLGIGKEVDPNTIYTAVEISHKIDDGVDIPNPQFDELFLNYYIDLFPRTGDDDYSCFADLQWLRDTNRLVVEKFLDEAPKSHLEEIRKRTDSFGSVNAISYELSLLQMILAGFVQVSTGEQEDRLYDIYKRLVAFQTGEDITFLSTLSRESLISRSSGLQNMFYSLFYKMETFLEMQLIANFDTILAPLVFLQNSKEESSTATFNDQGKVDRQNSYLSGILSAQVRINELLHNEECIDLSSLYNQKMFQLKSAILFILSRDHEGELFNIEFYWLKDKYKQILDHPISLIFK